MQANYLKSAKGFTLIELMVTIVIIGILLKVAVPAYTSYIQQANRTTAKTALLDFAAREEKYFSLNNAYTATASNLGYAAFPVNEPLTGTATYQINAPTINAGPPATFSVTASPVGSQASDACGTYTLNSIGQQGNNVTSGTAPGNCW